MTSLFNTPILVDAADSTRYIHVTTSACVMDGGFDDPITDGAATSNRRCMTFVVKRNAFATTLPRIGDFVTVDGVKRYSVTKVSSFFEKELILEARQCS